MPTVLLAGAFGQRNPGDEALLDAFLAALPGWRPIATSSDPASTIATHACEAVAAQDPFTVARAALGSDAVVFAGGTVFKTLHPTTGRPAHQLLRRALLLVRGAGFAAKPTAMLGVGVGSLPTRRARRLACSLVRHADLLILRDEESAHALAAAGAAIPLRVGGDPSWTLVDEPPTTSTDRDPVVVALSHLAGGDDLPDRLANALSVVIASGLRVQLQPWQRDDSRSGDEALARAVATRLRRGVEVIAAPTSLLEARAQFAGARLVVCLRFHAMVAAAAAGTPLVALVHEAKLAGLARRLQQPMISVAAHPSMIGAEILRGLATDAASPAVVRGEIARAAEGFRLLRVLLEQGAASEFDSFDGLSLKPDPWIVS